MPLAIRTKYRERVDSDKPEKEVRSRPILPDALAFELLAKKCRQSWGRSLL
ncbi:MAG: hypothetical protein AAGD25_22165 [Cyanobacteria bacterium P01_F01_bin.150]